MREPGKGRCAEPKRRKRRFDADRLTPLFLPRLAACAIAGWRLSADRRGWP
jgi:hypothetical protein